MIRDLKRIGYSSEEIAGQFNLSVRTVDHIRRQTVVRTVKCYCPACPKGKTYYTKLEAWDADWAGEGIWPKLCKKHAEVIPESEIEYTCNPFKESSERKIVEALAEEDEEDEEDC